MAAEEETAPVNATSNTNTNPATKGSETENWMEDLQRTVIDSKNTAISSARSFRLNASSNLRSLEDQVPHAISAFKTYEDAFVNKVKEEVMSAREHPAAAVGVALTAGLLLMRGPRRFLFRHTLGRLQSEEAKFLKAEKNVKEISVSVDLMKKESKKLLERTALAEKDMKHGQNELMNAGSQIQRLAKSFYKVETQATDLMDDLRQVRGREALQLRAEVASLASFLKQHRVALNKRVMKISELGIAV